MPSDCIQSLKIGGADTQFRCHTDGVSKIYFKFQRPICQEILIHCRQETLIQWLVVVCGRIRRNHVVYYIVDVVFWKAAILSFGDVETFVEDSSDDQI